MFETRCIRYMQKKTKAQENIIVELARQSSNMAEIDILPMYTSY